MTDLACVNGEFCPLSQAKVSINDRGLLFGDSVYEVIRAFNGKVFLIDEHLTRLADSLRGIKLDATVWLQQLPSILYKGLKRTSSPQVVIYIQITRGAQPRNLIFDASCEPTLIVTFREFSDSTAPKRETGVSVCLRPDIRWKLCSLKTTNLLPNVLLRNEAHSAGHYEAVLFNEEQQVTECCSSSIFLVEGEKIITPPLSDSILPGVSRHYVVNILAPQLGSVVLEEAIPIDRLQNAAEIFVTSTTCLMLPVVKVDAIAIANGKPGHVTKALTAAWLKNIELFRAG